MLPSFSFSFLLRFENCHYFTQEHKKDLKVRLCYQFPSENYKKSVFLFSRIQDAMVNSMLWPVSAIMGASV